MNPKAIRFDGSFGSGITRPLALLAASLITFSVAGAQSSDPAAGIQDPAPAPAVNARPQLPVHPDDPAVDTGDIQSATSSTKTLGSTFNNNAVDFTPGSGSCGVNQGQTIGWQFDVVNAVTVTGMTWFDDGMDGLDIGHEVAIWNPDGTMVAATNVTVPAGAGAPLDGNVRVVKIAPTTLTPGQGYIVGGYNGSHGECLNFNVTQVVDPDITYVDATFSALGASLERPASFSGAVNGFYGVGFQVGEAGGGGKKNGVDFVEGSGACGVNQGQTIGWQFDVLEPIKITSMSWFDDGQDGLDISHEVAIWDPSGNMIPSTNVVIPAGTAAALDGIWRVVPIESKTLQPGQGYIVGGYNGSHGECLSFNVTQTPNPSINYVDATFSALGASLERPASFSGANNGFYGVGFQIDTGGDDVEKYCQANPNSCGSPADIAFTDQGDGTFLLSASPVPAQPGIFFHAPDQIRVPFGNGFLCAGGGITRLLPPIVPPVDCGTGDLKQNFADYAGMGKVNFQYWYRDPAGGGQFFNTTNAISVQFP